MSCELLFHVPPASVRALGLSKAFLYALIREQVTKRGSKGCTISHHELARLSGLSRDTASRVTNQLKASGLLAGEKKHKGGPMDHRITYTLTTETKTQGVNQ